MAGKPGKSLLTTWHDDAQQSINQLWELWELWDEIEARYGIVPSFFKLAQNEPPIARNLFRQARFAYLDNPMPAHFKERLFTWLSRFCEARYCVARHCAFLIGYGRVAGDASAPPLPVERALALLNELMPDKEELPGYLRALEGTSAPLGDWPDFDSDLGRRFRVACAVVFLDPGQSAPWLRELLRLLGPQRYEQLMLFLAYVGAEHLWTEVHPELEFEPDLEAMLREHEALAEPLLHSADEAASWKLGRRRYDEMQSLREDLKNVAALRDSEARFRAIFENAAVGIARVAPDGHWLEVNQRLCDIVGYSREELMTKTFADITHPDDLEQDLRAMRRISAGEIDTFLMEKRYYRKDGFVAWVNLTVSVMRKADGSPDFFISIVEDIFERKQVEEKLRESQERLQIFIEHSPASLAMFDREMRYIAVSRRWMTDYRLGDRDIRGQSHYALFPEVPEHWKEAHRRSLEGEVVRAGEDRFVRADGEVQWVRWETRPWHTANGDIGGIVIFTEEITDRKLAAEALRESELRFRTMISAIPNLLYETDADGVNIFTSAQWRAYTGMTAEESAGTRFIRAYHPDEADEVLAQWRAAVRSGTPFERKCRIRAADGSYRWFLNRGQPGRDAEGRIVRWAGSLTDIDDLIRAEEKLRESELRFRTMVSAVPSLIYETDSDGNNILVSDQWLSYTGMTGEENTGSGFIKAYHPDEAENLLAQWSVAVRSGMSFESKCRIRAADGYYRSFLNRARPGHDAEGRIVRWAGSLTDIEDLVRIEQELRESRERLAGIVSTAMDAIITVDEDQCVVLFNEAAEKMFGCPAAEAIGQKLDRFIPKLFHAVHANQGRVAATGGSSRAIGRLDWFTALRADGSEFPIEAAISAIEIGGRKLFT